MTSRTASCHCGQLELRCDDEPVITSMCHCLECQRRTGSAFSVAVFFVNRKVTVVRGEPKTYTRESASGFPVTFHFCGNCGSNVYWITARLPQITGVAIGAFADPNFPQPTQSVWTKDKHAWFDLPENIAAFEINPPPRG